MQDRNPREEYLETLHQGYESFDGFPQLIWNTEYLTRSCRHDHYQGKYRADNTSMAGHELSDREGLNRSADPEHMLEVVLGFHANKDILQYCGPFTMIVDVLKFSVSHPIRPRLSADLPRNVVKTALWAQAHHCGYRVLSAA